jgi:predicted lipid-binding transport protein (Tim44 family)
MFGLGGRMPFMGFFGLAGCIWPLLLAALIVLAISVFSRRPAPYLMPPPQAPMPPAPAEAPASQAVCANCGQPLQPGWRHCPNCGAPVAQ